MGEAYDHIQRAYGEYYASAQTIPANATEVGDEGAQQHSGAMGGIEIITQVNTAVSFHYITALLEVWILHATTNAAAYFQTLCRACSFRAWPTKLGAAAPTGPYAAGTVFGRYVLPSDAYRYTKAVLKTDDDSASGALDIFPSLLPR